MDVITFPVNLLITSGLSILLHGVISLPDATSYVKVLLNRKQRNSSTSRLLDKKEEIKHLRGSVNNN